MSDELNQFGLCILRIFIKKPIDCSERILGLMEIGKQKKTNEGSKKEGRVRERYLI